MIYQVQNVFMNKRTTATAWNIVGSVFVRTVQHWICLAVHLRRMSMFGLFGGRFLRLFSSTALIAVDTTEYIT